MSSFGFKNDNVKIISLPGSPAQDGTDATGVNQPTGGVGIRGWLSGIYNLFFSGSAKVQLTGSIITIDGKTYGLSGGDTIRGKSADRPTAANAHAAIAYCYYYSVDTGAIDVTDGTTWVVI